MNEPKCKERMNVRTNAFAMEFSFFRSLHIARRWYAICAVHANIYGKMRFVLTPPLPPSPIGTPSSPPFRLAFATQTSGRDMLCTENDSNDKRERKKCAFLENDDKSVVVIVVVEGWV